MLFNLLCYLYHLRYALAARDAVVVEFKLLRKQHSSLFGITTRLHDDYVKANKRRLVGGAAVQSAVSKGLEFTGKKYGEFERLQF
jgi:hypothetical protein